MQDEAHLLEVIQRSLAIRRHVDFFRWLQADVRPLIPHQVLVAAWGDFAGGRLSFDVASALPGLRTRSIARDCAIAALMAELHKRWVAAGEGWLSVSPLALLGDGLNGPGSCLARWSVLRSVVAHGARDRRGRHDCLYAFFDSENLLAADPSTLELLLPSIDAALRRVEHLPSTPPAADAESGEVPAGISPREREIMTWLTAGKTNEEIGLILGISPNTVKNHLKRVYKKLDVFSRAQAVAKYALIGEPAGGDPYA